MDRISMVKPSAMNANFNMLVEIKSFKMNRNAPDYLKKLMSEQAQLSVKNYHKYGHVSKTLAPPVSMRSDFLLYVDCHVTTWPRFGDEKPVRQASHFSVSSWEETL